MTSVLEYDEHTKTHNEWDKIFIINVVKEKITHNGKIDSDIFDNFQKISDRLILDRSMWKIIYHETCSVPKTKEDKLSICDLSSRKIK